jgi:hypothetical protein
LKSKSNVKRDHSLGTLNKTRIWSILPRLCQKKGFDKGITLTDILKETKAKFPPNGYSKPTVISALRKLQADSKIFRIKSGYFLIDIFEDDGWSIFAGYLNYLLDRILHKLPLPSIQRIDQSDAEEDNIGELLFQFANRIGAFIVYLLIEAMHPTRKILPVHKRTEKAVDFIQTAMPSSDLFRAFINFLPESYSKNIVLGAQMRENSFKKLSYDFRLIYHSINKSIEKGYLNHFKHFYLSRPENFDYCDHQWKETFVHKIGMYHRCIKCRVMVKSPSKLQMIS